MSHAISVTRRHLPEMEHIGDITGLHGAKIPPVDIISFGSPCQGLSTAGKRLGLADPRSGLFSEAIRIISEMREATDGRYPRFTLWENVPGAMHSNRGLDYKAVLEAFTEAEVPVPPSGKWANAGMVRGGRADIAWCVYNAQYFGTAQRRRRIFLVADFTGECSGEILFIPKSLRGYFEAGGTPRQGSPTDAFGGADGRIEILNDQGGSSLNVERDGYSPTLRSETHGNLPVVARTVNCLTPWDTQQARIYAEKGASPTLAGADGGGGRNPAGLVFAAGFIAGAGAKAQGIGFEEECSPTMKSGGSAPSVICVTEQFGAVGVHQSQCGDVNISPTAYTLSTMGNASARNAPLVAHPAVNSTLPQVHPQISGTLCASGSGLSRPGGMASETDLCIVIPKTETIPIQDKATRYSGGGDTRSNDGCGNGLGIGKDGDPAPTITAGDRHAVAAYCLQGSMVGRQDRNGPNGSGINENLSFTLNTIDRHAVATAGTSKPVAFSLDSAESNSMKSANPNSGCRMTDTARTVDTTVPCPSKNQGGIAIVQPADSHISQTIASIPEPYQNVIGALCYGDEKGVGNQYVQQNKCVIDCGYIVRRLTPTECERLQGYPDGWTEFGCEGEPISDTRRYQMLGNSIAVPCVAYIMQGIAQAMAA